MNKEKPKETLFLEQISLRDYFAAKAINAVSQMDHSELQGFTFDYEESTTLRLAAMAAYQMADAMLEARK